MNDREFLINVNNIIIMLLTNEKNCSNINYTLLKDVSVEVGKRLKKLED